MKDKRAWAPVDIGYLDNPKMAKVLAASSTATLMHLASILYCAQHLTDGHIAPGVARMRVGGSKEDEAMLTRSGLWHTPGHDCESCPDPIEGEVYVHNFLEHNRTASDVKQLSDTRSDVAKKGWEKRKKQPASNAKSMQIAKQDEAVCNAEREREIKPPSSAHADAEFDRWWLAYPKKVGKQAAKKAYDKALKATDAGTLNDSLQGYVKATKNTERRFIANPATWLNEGRWDDELPDTKEMFNPWTA